MTAQLPADVRSALLEVVMTRGYTRRDEPFTLASGELSHDYVDMRRAVSRGADLKSAAEAVIAALEPVGPFDAIGGMTMGADPIAHGVALLSGRSWFSVRKAEKDHGTGRRIEGAEVGPGSRVIVFEDTVSTGGSLIDAYRVVEESGAEVIACVTVLDRGDLATARFRELGVDYLTLLDYRDLGIEPIRGGRGA